MRNPTTALVCTAWLEISDDPNHRDLWLCDETILRRIRSLHPTLNVNRTAINGALKSVAGSHHELNVLGLFHVKFKDICPYTTQKREVNYYSRYIKVKPSFPRIHSDVEDIIAKSFRLVEEREISLADSEKNSKNDANDNENKEVTENETNPGTTKSETTDTESAIPGTTDPETVLPEFVTTGESNPQIAISASVIPGNVITGITNTEITNQETVNPEDVIPDDVTMETFPRRT